MKTTLLFSSVAISFFIAPNLQAAPLSNQDAEKRGTYSVVERWADSRVWQRVTTENNGSEEAQSHVTYYKELASGMHYFENGQWLESESKIEITPEGATARKGPHKVNFPGTSLGLIDLTTADGHKLRSRVLGLSFFDPVTGKSALIAEIKESGGILTHPNHVTYADAFDGVNADIAYVYTKARFSQEIILNEPISPVEFGMPESSRLEILTEFVEAPIPTKTERVIKGTDGAQLPDEKLGFGSMKIGPGTAFLIGKDSTNNQALKERGVHGRIPVSKKWTVLDGRTFLIESVNYQSIKPHLETLPRPEAKAGVSNAEKTARLNKVREKRVLPVRREARNNSGGIKVASLERNRAGFLIDYEMVGDSTDYTFQGDTTYYVNGEFYISGTLTFEGGTVIKFSPDVTSTIYVMDGVFDCKTAPYRPVVITSRDDDTVGETIEDSTGDPETDFGKAFDIQAGAPVLENARITYGGWVISIREDVTSMTFNNVQFVDCAVAIESFMGPVNIQNSLFAHCTYPFFGAYFTFNVENATFHDSSYLAACWYGQAGSSLHITNSLGIGLTDWGNAGTVTTNNSFLTLANDSSVFQTVGAGSYYLATNSAYRNAGTTNINTNLLASLATKTTYPPLVYSNATINGDLTLSPQAQRDSDTPDLGYHYDPLDYAFGGTTANGNLTFTEGTAVAWFQTSAGYNHQGHGIHIGDTNLVDFRGTVGNYNYFTRYNTVQEGNGNWTTRFGPGGITGWATSSNATPEVKLNFTRGSMLAAEPTLYFREDYGASNGNPSAVAFIKVNMANSEFNVGILSGYNVTAAYTNCLFERLALGLSEGRPGGYLIARNLTMKGGSLGISRTKTNVLVSIKDSAFDGTDVSLSDSYVTNLTITEYDYNAVPPGGSYTTLKGTHGIIITNFIWQTSWLGDYYIRSTNTMVNAGSRTADLAGLYHFTTQTNQVKETNSTVDIGYHYVAVTNGIPIDSDSDGTPDYQEDSNGNGSIDSGETSTSDPYDLGLRVLITRPRNGSTIP